MTTTIARLLVAILCGLLMGWLLLPTPLAVCGFYNSESAPAWVQAIGSIAAILVAAGIPAWQEWRKETDEGKRLSIATLRLRSNLEALGSAAMDRAAKIRLTKVDEIKPSAVKDLADQVSLWEIGPVEQRIDQIHDLDPKITGPVLNLLEEYDQFLLVQERLRSADESNAIEQLRICGGPLLRRLEQISNLAFEASNAIRLIDEEQKYPDLRERNENLRAKAKKKQQVPGRT